LNRSPSPRDSTAAEIEGKSHGIAVRNPVGAFYSRLQLHMTDDAIRTQDLFPEDRANIRSRLSKWSCAVLEVALLIPWNRCEPCCRPIIVADIWMRDGGVRIQVIIQIVSHWKINPVCLLNHYVCFFSLDNLQLINWANTARE